MNHLMQFAFCKVQFLLYYMYYKLGSFDAVLYYASHKNLPDNLHSIQSPSPSVKIQIMGGKVSLRCKGKTFPPII